MIGRMDSPLLTTKRKVIAQVFVCQGCCCGQVEHGRPAVPAEWLKQEWRKCGLLKRVQLTISGCLGPCDVPNVVAIVTQTKTGPDSSDHNQTCAPRAVEYPGAPVIFSRWFAT